MGLKELIKLNFPDKKVYAIGDAKNTFDFLDFTMDEVPSDDIIKKSLAVVVDANHKERIEKREVLDKNLFAQVIRIDHTLMMMI
ncbi:Bifunctional oligoribonuclease and PAP phosphatase nrnA (plasmid) [Mycoplasmopsis canis]|uniref:Bifunctional oligoribonuclease and PAP phosphatase nrnA n=1 Tax=Mycoplasmopsis canis TaxID=29555 RepID=A0A449ART2_9BACT|nr:Bifunctional oligoribonuclease and PAP phosphatase nrnA [Mycoplasmopsis canis]